MASNRNSQPPPDVFKDDSEDDGSPNPLYMATSKSEHSTLNQQGKKTLAEISGSRNPWGAYEGRRSPADKDKRCDPRSEPGHHQGQQSTAFHDSQQARSNNHQKSHTGPRHVTGYHENERPDAQTWDQHAMGRTGFSTTGRSVAISVQAPGGVVGAPCEESPTKATNLTDEKKMEPPPKTMQARSLRLSLGTSLDLAKEPRKVPAVNCPEKIVLCLDISKETESLSFRMRNGDKVSFITLIKKALGIFFRTKHAINSRHEYALMVLSDSSLWMSDFCNDPMKILTILDDIPNLAPCESCELSSIFDELQKHVTLPPESEDVPLYMVRVILIYGRSGCIPGFNRKPCHRAIESSSYFCVDVLYVHEPASDENNCEKIFDALCDLDDSGTSYILEVSKNPTKVFDCMSQLLAHPLQRSLQQDVNYALEP